MMHFYFLMSLKTITAETAKKIYNSAQREIYLQID